MAVYKVPQDVEAEDKLIAWLSFRQFIYLGVAAVAAVVAFFFFQIFPALVIIPLPIVFLFGALALPIRKDQPLETYLLAVARFYLKPKVRKWDPDGTINYVEITAPKVAEPKLYKEYSGDVAQERLDYLARIMDSRGWAYKNAAPNETSVAQNVTSEATNAVDVLDEQADVAKNFASLIARQKQESRQEIMQRMQNAQSAPGAGEDVPSVGSARPMDDGPTPNFNPYPTSMHQKIVLPMNEQKRRAAQHPKPAASPKPAAVSPAIAQLASSKGLSVSAIAHEAHRLEEKDGGEVVIKLH